MKKEQKTASGRELWKLLREAKSIRPQIALACVLSLILVGCVLAIPKLMGSLTQALIDLIQVDGGVTAASVINLGYAHLALGELPPEVALRAYSEGSDAESAAGFARLCAYCLVSVGQNIIESGALAQV